MEELKRLEIINEEIINSNMKDETKKIVLELIKARVFSLRSEMGRIEENINFVHEEQTR